MTYVCHCIQLFSWQIKKQARARFAGCALGTSGDTSGKIVMQHYQVEKGNSATDEDMCILHDRKSE
jgi:hypothetical protein